MPWGPQVPITGRSTTSGFTAAHVKAAGDPNVRRLRMYCGRTANEALGGVFGPFSGESANAATSERVTMTMTIGPTAGERFFYDVRAETSPGSGTYATILESPLETRTARADGQSFSFGIIGDLHTDGYPGAVSLSLMAQRIANAATFLRSYGVDFLAFIGDKDAGGPVETEPAYEERLKADADYIAHRNMIRPFTDYLPWYETPGNHESFAPFFANAAANYANWVKYGINPTDLNADGRYWRLRWNDLLEMIGLDVYTGSAAQALAGWMLDPTQETAYAAALAASSATWRLAMQHMLCGGQSPAVGHPNTTYGRGGPEAVLQPTTYQCDTLHQMHQEGNIDSVLIGHDHKHSHGTVHKPGLLGRPVEYISVGVPALPLPNINPTSHSEGFEAAGNCTMRFDSQAPFGVWVVDVSPTALAFRCVRTSDAAENPISSTLHEYTLAPRWSKRRLVA